MIRYSGDWFSDCSDADEIKDMTLAEMLDACGRYFQRDDGRLIDLDGGVQQRPEDGTLGRVWVFISADTETSETPMEALKAAILHDEEYANAQLAKCRLARKIINHEATT